MGKNRKILIIITGTTLFFVGVFLTQYHFKPLQKISGPVTRIPAIESKGSAELRKNLEELLVIVNDQNPYIALQELQHRMDTNQLIFKNCHALAHEIGHEAFKKYNNFATALQYQDITCSDGYLHGVIEQAFADQYGDVTALLKKVQTLCNNLQGQSSRCYHGVGHAMMFYTSNNLPQALILCERLSGDARSRCYEGTFMENFLSDPALHPSKFVDSQNPFNSCKQQKDVYKSYCYFYVPIYYLHTNKEDYAQALAWCETAEKGYASTCVQGVGSLIVKYNIKESLFGEKLCAASPHMPACIAGMVSYGLTFYGSGKKVMENMCNPMDAKYKSICLNYLNEKVHLF